MKRLSLNIVLVVTSSPEGDRAIITSGANRAIGSNPPQEDPQLIEGQHRVDLRELDRHARGVRGSPRQYSGHCAVVLSLFPVCREEPEWCCTHLQTEGDGDRLDRRDGGGVVVSGVGAEGRVGHGV